MTDEHVSIKVHRDVYDRIKKLAEREDRSITATVRRAVKAYEELPIWKRGKG